MKKGNHIVYIIAISMNDINDRNKICSNTSGKCNKSTQILMYDSCAHKIQKMHIPGIGTNKFIEN